MQQIIKLILGSVVALVLWGIGPLAASAQVLRNTFAGGGAHSLSIHADGTLWATGNNTNGQLGDNTTVNKNTWVPIGTDTDWVQVAAGLSHSLALKANGTLYAWGANASGQLGSGTTTDIYTPTAVAGTYTQLAAGYLHSMALGPDGTLYAWGDNANGQVGDGTTTNKVAPTAIVGTYTRIAAGYYHSLALRPNGTMWAWGFGSSGQLGTGGTATQTVPTAVVGGHVFTQLAAGAFFSLGLRNDGRIYAWGANNLNQLGNGTTSSSSTPAPISGNTLYSQVAAGGFHGLGLRPDGVLEAWGQNAEGQIGNNSNTRAAQPTIVSGNGTYVQVMGGQNHSLALRADGTLYTWGDNTKGQLGAPTFNPNLYVPTAMGTALPTRSTAAGGAFGLAIKGDGTLWSWGDNTFGQLGDGTTTDRVRPLQVGAARTWIQVVAGNHHALGLQADGSVWAWGNNSMGQLGTGNNAGTTTPNVTPVQVSAGPYVRLAAGEAYSLALTADGTLFAWGANEAGQLGIATTAGATTPNSTPTAVPGQYAYVTAGATHTLALQATGTLYAWGANASGQLGTVANATPNPTPTALGTDAYTQVAAGQAHSLALQATGTLYAWGSNDNGQLGTTTNTGTTVANPTPTVVTGQYAQVTAGYARTLARRANGTIWAWGADDNGQLGLGTTIAFVSTPTQEITQATNWTTLAAGPLSKSSLVRTPSAQSFASAGLNNEGQLGDGTTTDAPRFDRVIPLAASAPGPLPVTLVSFEARRTGPATVALTWATATETNNAGFTVQKSTDGVAFLALGFVAGAGTSAAAHAYTYTDGQALGRSYYRLAQRDTDGTITYSPVGVVEGAAATLSLAPNPAHGAVQVLGLAPDATLVVYDELGRTVRPAAATLDVTGLPAGIYLVRATAPHQAPQTARLVVE
jgi:alpha-tubulin suppressor-like RCC1 family protein